MLCCLHARFCPLTICGSKNLACDVIQTENGIEVCIVHYITLYTMFDFVLIYMILFGYHIHMFFSEMLMYILISIRCCVMFQMLKKKR